MTFITNDLGTVSTLNSNQTLNEVGYNRHAGTAQSATASTIVLENTASTTDDAYNTYVIETIAGTGSEQLRLITDYEGNGVGGTQYEATISPNWEIIPDSTTKYIIHFNSGQCQRQTQSDTSNTIILSTNADSNDGVYAGAFIRVVNENYVNIETRNILVYTGSTKTALIDTPWLESITNSSLYIIYGEGGTAPDQSGATSTQIFLDGNQLNVSANLYIDVYSGTGAGQIRKISGVVTNTVTVTAAWDVQPASGDLYTIFGGWGGTYEDISEFAQSTLTNSFDLESGERVILDQQLGENSTGTQKKNLATEFSPKFPTAVHSLVVVTQFYRIRLISMGTPLNGGTQSIYHKNKGKHLTSLIEQGLNPNTDCELVRAVIAAKTHGGVFRNLRTDTQGHLFVSLANSVSSFGEMSMVEHVPVAQLSFIYGIKSHDAITTVDRGSELRMITEGTAGVAQVQELWLPGGSRFTSTGAGDYFLLYSAGDATTYYVWFNVDAGNSDPSPGGTGLSVAIGASDTPTAVASAAQTVIDANGDFSASSSVNQITITNAANGVTTSINIATIPSTSNSSVSVTDSLLNISNFAGSNSVAELRSRRGLRYRPGQGALIRITGIFDSPLAGTDQLVGYGNISSGLFFGYNGTQFGILRRNGGKSEIRLLTITTGAGGSENATIIIDGITFTVPLTSGTAQDTAREISEFDYSLINAYAEQIDNTVQFAFTCTKSHTNTFSFTSATAVGTFSTVTTASQPTDEWFYQDQWNNDKMDGNGPSGMFLNPQRGNVFQIQMQWLGFGALVFMIEDDVIGKFTPVHIIRYSNFNTQPSLIIPHGKLTWSVKSSSGNQTTLGGSSGALLVEGRVIRRDPVYSFVAIKTTSGNDVTAILTLLNPRCFAGLSNNTETFIKSLSLLNNDNNNGLVFIIIGATLTGTNYQYIDENVSAIVVDNSSTAISGGKQIMTIALLEGQSKDIDLEKLDLVLQSGESVTIACQRTSNKNIEIAASITWVEDH